MKGQFVEEEHRRSDRRYRVRGLGWRGKRGRLPASGAERERTRGRVFRPGRRGARRQHGVLEPGRHVAAAGHTGRSSTSLHHAEHQVRELGPAAGGSTYDALGNGGQGGESAFVPALYGTWMIDPQWSVGLAINAPFGLGTEWDSRWAGQFHGIKSEIETLNINPTVSFKVNNMISLGARRELPADQGDAHERDQSSRRRKPGPGRRR